MNGGPEGDLHRKIIYVSCIQ